MSSANPSLPLLSVVPFIGQQTTPLVLQAEVSECGLACLAMIAGYHGKAPDMHTLRSQYAVSNQGATLRQIMQVAEHLALSCRAVKLDLAQLNQLALPCILHWDLNHFVVLTSVSNKQLVVHDPAVGKRSFNLNEFGQHFTGIALELTPTGAFSPEKKSLSLGLTDFLRNATGLKRHLLVLFCLSLLLQLFAVVSPYYMQLIIDDVVVRHDTALLTVLLMGFSLLLVIEIVTQSFRQRLLLAMTSKLSLLMSTNVFHHLIRLPFSYFAKRHLGDLVSRFQSLGPVREMLSHGLVSACLDGLMAVITLVVMYFYNAYLATISVAIVGVYLAVKFLVYRPMHRINTEKLVASANENSHFMESLRAIKTVKLLGQEPQRENVWQHKLIQLLNTDIRLQKWQINLVSINKLLFGAEHLIIIYFAALAVIDNTLSVGMMYAFIAYKTRFTNAADNIITTVIELKLLSVHFDRLSDILFTERDRINTTTLPSAANTQQPMTIRCEALGYRYSTLSPHVFSNVDLHIESGECVAVTGPSGCGKTTLLHCLMGLLEPNEGRIFINDKSLGSMPDYRSRIAAVLQEDQCMSGSIADNIACFDPAPNNERIGWAAEQACLHQDIMQMPMQYQTLVGDMGSCLSGGQLQRLLIARALYRQPSILFMDEATAHLDTATELKVNQNLAALKITRIIIAHRPQTIAMAGRVLHLHNGTLTPLVTSAKGENQ